MSSRGAALVLAVSTSACVTGSRLEAPPFRAGPFAPSGLPETVRSTRWRPTHPEADADAGAAALQAAATDGAIDVLALSGGGSGGAFGAGVLVGLSEAGARPQYEVVTGVSTGALIAPFAFLGSDWDSLLIEAFSGEATENLLEPMGIGILFSSSIYDGEPLRRLVSRYVSDDLLRAVAREYRAGRKLWVATTNLDREESVFWDLGAIAVAAGDGNAQAKTLFIDVLVASASVPGVFPAVLLDVADAGARYQEMHVDGGASTPFFVAFDVLAALNHRVDGLRNAQIYVIANSQLAGTPRTTPANTLSIVSRAFTSTVNHMTQSALTETFAFSERNEMLLSFTSVSASYPFAGPLAFAKDDMRRLFSYGRQCAAQGKVWLDAEQALAETARAQGDRNAVSCPTGEPIG